MKLKNAIFILFLALLCAAIAGCGIASALFGDTFSTDGERGKNDDLDPRAAEIYELTVPEGFLPEIIKKNTGYQMLGGIKHSVESGEEAVGYVRQVYDRNKTADWELLDLRLAEEGDFYYTVFKSYVSRRVDHTYSNTYVFYKRDIFDADEKRVNLDRISGPEELKTIFNVYNYVSRYEIASYKLEKSAIRETEDAYIYTLNYYMIVYGDWGMHDMITYYSQDTVISKADGAFTEQEPVALYSMNGKYHPNTVFSIWD